MAVNCSVKRVWIASANQNEALKQADEINGKTYRTSNQKAAYGFAKAVCQVNGKWGVRVLQADFGAPFKSIEDFFGDKAKVAVLKPATGIGRGQSEPCYTISKH